MSKYSIKDLERLSGIKAHTIRIWEQRYNIISPERTDTNIRYYSNEDLKRILNISILNNHGVKISKIAGMSSHQIESEVKQLVDQSVDHQDQIEGLIVSMVEMDEERFEEIINQVISTFGFVAAMEQIIYPFFDKIGVLWQTGSINPAQEHFMSNLIRQKIIVSIDAMPTIHHNPKGKVLLFLREGEMHEIGLLVQYYMTKQLGYKPYYLGQSVPYDDLASIVKIAQPDYISTILTNTFEPGELNDFIQRISSDFKTQTIFLSGYALKEEKLELPPNVRLVSSIIEFRQTL